MEYKSIISCIALLALFIANASAATYNVRATRLSTQPVINSQRPGESAFTFNYNAAYVDLGESIRPGHHVDALIVRCQNATSMRPLKVGPSKLALAVAKSFSDFTWSNITLSTVVFQSQEPWENYGTEDPRVAYDPKTKEYYMLYSAVQQLTNGSLIVRLSLATAKNPADPKSWVRHGPIFKDDPNGYQWTKSGAILVRETSPNYLIFGDSTLMPGIQVATSNNLLSYDVLPGIFIHTREDHFDSALVEAGPPPVRLSDGNYLFLYNSAKKYPSSPNGLQYNIGWAILDGNDPLKILARSSVPILSPELPWELGTAPYLGLTPNVVFVEGINPRSEKGSDNEFRFYYGAADSVIGLASVKVTIHS